MFQTSRVSSTNQSPRLAETISFGSAGGALCCFFPAENKAVRIKFIEAKGSPNEEGFLAWVVRDAAEKPPTASISGGSSFH